MARAPRDYNEIIRQKKEKAAERAARLKEAVKASKGQNDKQNARLLRQSAVHSLPPAVRMGAFLELEQLMKDPRAVKRWTERGEAFFRSEPPRPRLVAEQPVEHHETEAAA